MKINELNQKIEDMLETRTLGLGSQGINDAIA